MIEKADRAIKIFLREKVPDVCPQRIGILFSGGRDSSILAAMLAKQQRMEIHLITIDNGISYELEVIKDQAQKIIDLPESAGSIIKAVQLDIRKEFQETVMREIEADFIKRGFKTLLACVGCKYLMHKAAAEYAHKHSLHGVVDGFALRQQAFPEQTTVFMKGVEGVYHSLGLVYDSPLYDVLDTKENVLNLLSDVGLEGKQEGKCMFAYSFSTASNDEIAQYLEHFKTRLD